MEITTIYTTFSVMKKIEIAGGGGKTPYPLFNVYNRTRKIHYQLMKSMLTKLPIKVMCSPLDPKCVYYELFISLLYTKHVYQTTSFNVPHHTAEH